MRRADAGDLFTLAEGELAAVLVETDDRGRARLDAVGDADIGLDRRFILFDLVLDEFPAVAVPLLRGQHLRVQVDPLGHLTKRLPVEGEKLFAGMLEFIDRCERFWPAEHPLSPIFSANAGS